MRRTIAVATLLVGSSVSCGIDPEPAHTLLQRELAKCAVGPRDDEASCISWSLFVQRATLEQELPAAPDEPLRAPRRFCEDGTYRYPNACPENRRRMLKALERATEEDRASTK